MLMLLRVGILPVDMQIVLFNSDRQLCPPHGPYSNARFPVHYLRKYREIPGLNLSLQRRASSFRRHGGRGNAAFLQACMFASCAMRRFQFWKEKLT
jgi:hypothetical protein